MIYYIIGFTVTALGIALYKYGNSLEEVSFRDKRSGKLITRIRDKKTKKFVA